jgi:hypothetical protein
VSLLRQMRYPAKLLSVLVAASTSFAADFTSQTVDGLNRPVAGVHLEVECESPAKKITTLLFDSDQDGVVNGTYDERLCKPFFVSLKKGGYVPYSAVLRDRYVLDREFAQSEIEQIINLNGDEQLQALRELLIGWDNFTEIIFQHDSRVLPALRALAGEPEVTLGARSLLALIGTPSDLQMIMQLPPPPRQNPFPERWRYSVVTALINPESEEEWNFLRSCALNQFDDRWVDAGAIQTLKLAVSPRSEQILVEAATKNIYRAASIARALEYIRSSPAPLRDADLDALAARVAQTLGIGKWEGNKAPRFNETGDNALIDLTFLSGEDRLIHTAAFHRADGLWTLRGVHETLQMHIAPRPRPAK